eukprot:1144491-Pelagomonas_calceolata.AAC.6
MFNQVWPRALRKVTCPERQGPNIQTKRKSKQGVISIASGRLDVSLDLLGRLQGKRQGVTTLLRACGVHSFIDDSLGEGITVSQKQHLNARIKAAVHDMNEIEKTAKQRSTGKIALMSPKVSLHPLMILIKMPFQPSHAGTGPSRGTGSAWQGSNLDLRRKLLACVWGEAQWKET